MTHSIIPVKEFDFIIIGATGDLSTRKLLPALYKRFDDGQIPEGSKIYGSARSKLKKEEFLKLVEESIKKYVKTFHEDSLNKFLELIEYFSMDVFAMENWLKMKKFLGPQSDSRVRIFYLSVAPPLFEGIINGLIESKLNKGSRLVVEKPLGHDYESAKALNAQLAQAFNEDSIYRIDHYLGKETVQNLMAMRFANSMFEPLWNAKYIDHVQITVAETLGLDGRGGYYDKSGAMRDMVQNHLLQLLCLTAMESPYTFDANGVRDEKLKVLKSLRTIEKEQVAQNTVRGQYLDGDNIASYLEDVNNEKSAMESFVALKVEIDNWRWAGTPFYLRTGKRLKSQLAEINIVFKQAPHSIFTNLETPIKANELIIRLQPDEGIDLSIMTKEPGPGGFRLRATSLDTAQNDEHQEIHQPDAYERLILDVVRGNQTLFMRGDEVEAAWQWVDPIIAQWVKSGIKPEVYDPLSQGPTSAVELIARDSRRWRLIK